MKKVAICQSNYIPWKGYFDLIGCADEFVIYDHVQYTRNDWRNRNKIKTKQGLIWLTIPVLHKGNFGQSIENTKIANQSWRKKHWKALEINYGRAPHFDRYAADLKALYLENREEHLSNINHRFLNTICGFLGINTRLTFSREFDLPGGKTENLVAICSQLGATEYITGPSARNYVKEEMFANQNIRMRYADYSHYEEYEQYYSPFKHGVSILDLLFCKGPDAAGYMKFRYDKL